MNKRKIVLKSLFALFLLSALGLGCLGGGSTGSSDTTTSGTTGGTTGGTTSGTTGGTSSIGTITITVGSGTTPQYSWTGGGVAYVAVSHIYDRSNPVWSIVSMSDMGIFTNLITSPVRHGTVPAGFAETANTAPVLTAGVEYEVLVTRFQSGSTRIEAQGTKTFIP